MRGGGVAEIYAAGKSTFHTSRDITQVGFLHRNIGLQINIDRRVKTGYSRFERYRFLMCKIQTIMFVVGFFLQRKS